MSPKKSAGKRKARASAKKGTGPSNETPGARPKEGAPRAKKRTPATKPTVQASRALRPRRGSPEPPAPTAATAAGAEPQLLDLLPGDPPVFGDIPWGYAEDRVTAMARDPHWLFVYWELTDEAIARARAGIGAPDAACVLRVYDTTYRLFDGTNANWSMDIPIHRPANNHYVYVGRPGATFHVDLGVKSAGEFARIARSGPVETPRDSISADTRVEWMTVTPESKRPEYRHRFVSRRGAPPVTAWAPPEAELERVMQSLVGEGWTRAEWEQVEMGGRVARWVRRTGPFRHEQWRTVPGAPVEIVFEGERRVLGTDGGERIVFGPWRVTIHRVGPEGGRRGIDRWLIHYAWPTEEGWARVETGPILRRILTSYRTAVATAGSEARLAMEAWSSEILQLGASEWHWLQGSEQWFAGASEMLWLGASEVRALGASEMLGLGASEMRFAGASGLLLGSASEWTLPTSSGGLP